MGATPSSIPSIVEASHHPSQTIRGTTTMHRSVAAKLHFNEKEIIKVMYPVYFIEEDATKEEIKRAEESWELILQDKTPEYLERKAKEGENFPYQSCITFFFDLFYTRLFEIHPMCRHLFVSGIKIQGRFLVKMIGLALSVYHDPVKFDEFLGKLALGHYEKGVKAIECKNFFLPFSRYISFSSSHGFNRWNRGSSLILVITIMFGKSILYL